MDKSLLSTLTVTTEDALKAQIFGCWSSFGLPYNENF